MRDYSNNTLLGRCMTLSSNMEDYLEAILYLTNKKTEARTKDIAAHLQVKMPSVNKALKKLADLGYLNYDPYITTTLTKKGEDYANNVLSRHNKIKKFLQNVLNTQENIAELNACKLEHILDKDLIDKLTIFTEFIENCNESCSKIKSLKAKLKK